MPSAAILDQIKVVTVKDYSGDLDVVPPIESFLYAISLVNGIRIQIDATQTKFA